MSMDIYYRAKRNTPLSAEEQTKIDEIMDTYWEEYPRKDEYEGPGTFGLSGEDDDVIYFGNLRVPLEFMSDGEDDRQSYKVMKEFMDYWLKFLTDITRVLSDAEWDAGLEDLPLIWEEENGWRFMSEEEFGEMDF